MKPTAKAWGRFGNFKAMQEHQKEPPVVPATEVCASVCMGGLLCVCVCVRAVCVLCVLLYSGALCLVCVVFAVMVVAGTRVV